MKRQMLISSIADAIEIKEGYHTKPNSEWWPALPQQLINPGNVRRWTSKHPTEYGYINFYKWAGGEEPLMPRRPTASTSKKSRRETLDRIWAEMQKRDPEKVAAAQAEGRRVLEALIGQYVDGKYTNGQSPSLLRMFQTYAPSNDGNNPYQYAEFVGERLGLDRKAVHEVPLAALCE